jgi:hypothetical protein
MTSSTPTPTKSLPRVVTVAQPGTGYFGFLEFRELNSGFYHDTVHALEVAELVREMALSFGRSPQRAEFLKQVALVHDADPRICQTTGSVKTGTPARVQVTIAWMESQREHLERRFGWEGFEFEEACALIARTDYPFDRVPRAYGTYFDGLSPVELFRQRMWKVPGELRGRCFTDALLLRFADQIAAYVGSFDRAQQSVRALCEELLNTGAQVKAHEMLSATPRFLAEVGRDLEYDGGLSRELNNADIHLPERGELLAALGWRKRLRLFLNVLRFKAL